MKLTVVVSAYNEEKKIEECLTSASKVADEIIVIDNSSDDDTAKIAKKFTKIVSTRPNNKMLNINKNYGASLATGDWILHLDADERIESDLAAEIKNVMASRVPNNAFKIPRKNIIFGKWIEHTGWYPDFQTRLFRRKKGKFEEKHNHEQLSVEGETGSLQSPLLHEHYATVDEFLKKTFFSYTDNEADAMLKKGYKFKTQDLLKIPFNEFLSRYFARYGYKDGRHGLALSLLMAFYHFVVVLKIWEKEKFETKEDDTLNILNSNANDIKKELKFWNSEINLKKMSPIRQTIERAKRKFA